MENKNNDKEKFVIQLEKRTKLKLIKRYDKPLSYHDVKMINDILFNEKTHYVEIFKEFLIFEDYNEFLKKYYNLYDIKFKLSRILFFYSKYSKIYANYTSIPESKYMYKNIKRKQKMIEQMNNNNYNYSEYENDNSSNEYYTNTIFTEKVINSIYNKSSSTNKKDIILDITKSTVNNSLNNFIEEINHIEKNIINENKQKNSSNSMKKINNFSYHKKSLSNSAYNKKRKKNNGIKKKIEDYFESKQEINIIEYPYIFIKMKKKPLPWKILIK